MAFAALIGCLALAVVAIGTAPPGPGLDPDAMSYLGAAESLVRSGSLRVPSSSWSSPDSTEPLSHFPPAFPAAIAVPTALGARPVQAARLINIGAAFATWCTLVLLVANVASLRVAVLAALATLATPAIINLHLSVLSEPLFFLLVLATIAGVLALERSTPDAPTRGRHDLWIALATGFAVAAVVMLRYAAIALLVATWPVAVWGRSARQLPWTVRLQRATIITLPTVAASGAWLSHTVHVSGTRGVRRLGIYGGFLDTVREGFGTTTAWLIPAGQGAWRYPVACLAAVGATVVAVQGWKRLRIANPPAAQFLRFIGAIAACYFLVIAASRLFADPNIPFDERMLSLLMLLGEVAFAVLLAAWWPRRSTPSRTLVAAAVALWFGASTATSLARIVYARDDGNDFASSDWRNSPTIAWVRAPNGGANAVLYSNWPSALYFHAHRAAHDIPATSDALTMRRFRDRLLHTHGVLVGFAAPSPDVVNPDTLARVLGLREVARLADGAVWSLPDDSVPARK